VSDAEPKLLVVDDIDDNRFALTRRLARQGYLNVATASDGPAALIEQGRDGLLVPLTRESDGAAEALADAMQRIAGDAELRARLAQGGRAAYEASFTEAAIVGRYRAFFDEVAG